MYEEPRLFELPPDECHVHLSWSAEEGWSLWASTWDRATGPKGAASEGYDRMTYGEALTALDAFLYGRMPWLFEEPLY